MGNLVSYFLVSGLVMLGMYLVYKLLMARETLHTFNRCILLTIYLVSFSIYPLFNLIETLIVESTTKSTDGITEIGRMTLEVYSPPMWGTVVIWIFLVGASIVAIKTIITWIRIVRVVRSGERLKKNGFTLVITDNDKMSPFSWMFYVVINRTDIDNRHSAIITHELKHVRSFHWFDLFVAQIVCIVNWFNPAAWLMRDELMLVHEYQADMAVIKSGQNAKEYQMLLIKKAVGSRFPSLANSINHSKLKKRITMMYKSKSCAGKKFKALALVPMAALALGVASVPAVKAAVSTICNSEVSLDKGSKKLPKSSQFRINSLNDSGIETTVVVVGEGLGDYISVSDVFFNNKGSKYSANSVQTTMTDGVAVITAVFPFSDSYENASVVLNINGQDVKLSLDDFRKKSQTTSVSISPANGIEISQGNATLSNLSDMTIYLDGKKISEEEMKAMSAETIGSMSIDKQSKTIRITSK